MTLGVGCGASCEFLCAFLFHCFYVFSTLCSCVGPAVFDCTNIVFVTCFLLHDKWAKTRLQKKSTTKK